MSHWYDSMILRETSHYSLSKFSVLKPFYAYPITKHILRLYTDPTAAFPPRGYDTKETGRSLCNVCTVQYRKWSPTANDPETASDPQNGPQMILDRKWSPKSTANDPVKNWGMDWIFGTVYKEGPYWL